VKGHVVFGAFIQCETRAAPHDTPDDIFYRPEARSDPRLPVSVGAMAQVIVWRRAKRFARRRFSSSFRAPRPLAADARARRKPSRRPAPQRGAGRRDGRD